MRRSITAALFSLLAISSNSLAAVLAIPVHEWDSEFRSATVPQGYEKRTLERANRLDDKVQNLRRATPIDHLSLKIETKQAPDTWSSQTSPQTYEVGIKLVNSGYEPIELVIAAKASKDVQSSHTQLWKIQTESKRLLEPFVPESESRAKADKQAALWWDRHHTYTILPGDTFDLPNARPCSGYPCELGKHTVQLKLRIFPVTEDADGRSTYLPCVIASNTLDLEWRRPAPEGKLMKTKGGDPLDVDLVFTNPGPAPIIMVRPPGTLMFPDLSASLMVRSGGVETVCKWKPLWISATQKAKEQLQLQRTYTLKGGNSFRQTYRISEYFDLHNGEVEGEVRITSRDYPGLLYWETNPEGTELKRASAVLRMQIEGN